MKSKVYVSGYLARGRTINGLKRDVLVLASADVGDVSQPRPCKDIVLDRADEGRIREVVKTAISNYIAALPDPSVLAGLIHRTHCHGVPLREQYKVTGARRAMVMGPNPITEEVRFAIEEAAQDRTVPCFSVRDLEGEALRAAEDFLAKAGFNWVNASEKRALMLATGIKTKNYATKIAQLLARQEKSAARRRKIANRKVRLKTAA